MLYGNSYSSVITTLINAEASIVPASLPLPGTQGRGRNAIAASVVKSLERLILLDRAYIILVCIRIGCCDVRRALDRGRFGVKKGSKWGRFGVGLGALLCRLCVVFGHFWSLLVTFSGPENAQVIAGP